MSVLHTIVLPEPPSANRYWRNVLGRMVKSREARVYQRTVSNLLLMGRVRMIAKPTPVKMSLTWYRGRKSGDLDNRAKIALDAVRGLLFTDDSQIVELHLYRAEDKDRARIELTVEAA